MTRVAVTSRSFSKHPVLRAEIQKRYTNITFNDVGKRLVENELVEFLRGHEKAIIGLEIIDDSVLSRLSELKLISKVGVGLDGIDLAALAKHHVQLAWTPGVNRRSVAELVLAYAISLLRHIPALSLEVKKGKWRQVTGRLLTGRTVGIIGFGAIGQDVARLLEPFECKIMAYDIAHDSITAQGNSAVQAVDLTTLLRESDVVTLHLPLDESTRRFLDADRLALMKPSAILINTARGRLVDEAALKKMLLAGRLGGAALDAFEEEPPTDTELLQLPNFLGSPHIGGSSEEAILAMGMAAIEGLEKGRVPTP